MKSLYIFISFIATGYVQAEHKLWYEQPAKDWHQALPVGNGRLGAMVFGDPLNENIQLNEDSVWGGELKDTKNVIGSPKDLAEMRQLIDEGKQHQADSQLMKRFSRGGVVRSHQTLGNLRIKWKKNGAELTDYKRELDLSTGLATSTWKKANTTFTQQVFCSNPDEAIFVKISATGAETLNFAVALDRRKDGKIITHKVESYKHAGVDSLYMSGQVTQSKAKLHDKPVKGMLGVKFGANMDLVHTGGSVVAKDGMLHISGANTVYIRLTAATDFDNKKIDLKNQADGTLAKNFDLLMHSHFKDHASLYDRCRLDIVADKEISKLPTDKRLARLTKSNQDKGLEALMFHYGRYLLIASSRTNGNPANLQGLWNKDINAPWNADYHLNINLQMNYWAADSTNLSETHTPVFRWMQRLAKNGAETAEKQYGMRGWVAHHASELFGQTVMKASRTPWGGWIHGGGWMCQHIWTHYEYTQDKKFLKEKGYPLLAGQARFYLDWLVEKDGKLISYPETSPENSFRDEKGRSIAVCAKAAMGQQIITEVLTNTLAAAKVLGIENAFTKEVAVALTKIDRGLHVGEDGRILEWDKPYREAQKGHRHLSHLYAFHPGISVTHEKTPELIKAAKKSIDVREKHNSVGVGWSRAWAISIYSRLRDGDVAQHHLHEMLRTQTLGNGFNSVFGKKRELFQIEANLGATAGVAEMLLQSHGGFIHILPALPSSWSEGSIKGLKARGNYLVDIAWKDGKLTQVSITSLSGQTPKVRIANEKGEVALTTDKRVKFIKK